MSLTVGMEIEDQGLIAVPMCSALRAAQPASWAGFDELAADFRIRVSTRRGRLEEEGQSIRAIKDALRRDLAIRQLTRTPHTVGEIAQALGFAEPSAFHRAFRQWTGVSPGDYRQRSRGV